STGIDARKRGPRGDPAVLGRAAAPLPFVAALARYALAPQVVPPGRRYLATWPSSPSPHFARDDVQHGTYQPCLWFLEHHVGHPAGHDLALQPCPRCHLTQVFVV